MMILFMLFSSLLRGAILTVCASGCSYTSVPTAYTNANPGDIIEAKAGETFVISWKPAWKNWGKAPITIRSSRWMELPPAGYRVTWTDHGALMPIFESLSSDPTTPMVNVAATTDYSAISSVDTGANTITLDASTGIVNGDPIACRPSYSSAATMPGGVNENQNYIITGASGATFSLLEYAGGSTVDITSAGSGTRHCVPSKTARNLVFDGIAFRPDSAAAVNSAMLQIGTGNEASYLGMPAGVKVRRSVFVGDEGENGPKFGIRVNARGTTITDTFIDQIKYDSADTQAIWGGATTLGLTVKNVYASAASIPILTGGQGVAINGGVVRGFSVDRVAIVKHGSYLYNSGAGAPSGNCFTGRYYRNTTPSPNTCANGACYRCVASAWVPDTGTYYQNYHYSPKANLELKQCVGCSFKGMVIKNGFAANDAGNPGYCLFASQVDPHEWSRIENTSFRDIYCDNTWRGVAVGTEGGHDFENKSVTFSNILIENMALFPDMSIWSTKGDVQAYAYRMDGGIENSLIDHVTARVAPASTGGTYWMLMDNPGGAGQILGSYIKNTLGMQYTYGLFPVGADSGCTGTGLGIFISSAGQFANNLQDGASTPGYASCVTNLVNVNPIPYVSAGDSRLTSGSPYSANCSSGCAFTGTDGKDPGADVDRIVSETAEVESGGPGWIPNLKIKMGSTRGIVSYWAPDDQVCTVTLYTDLGRVTEDADTTGANKNDNRTGNVTVGRSRQFVLGTVDALSVSTTYAYKLSCPGGGGQYRVGTLKTYAAASGGQLAGFSKGGSSVASQYSSAATMGSPTAISASTNPRFTVPQGTVRYWQTTSAAQNGPVIAVVAR